MKTANFEREQFNPNLVNIGEMRGSNDIKELPMKMKASVFGVSCTIFEFDTETCGPFIGHLTK